MSKAITSARKLRDFLSVGDYSPATDGVTSSQAAVASAVAQAFSEGKDLYWPDYDFVSTDSIPNFWSVRHQGPGRIKRGSTTYKISPARADVNQLWVSTAGSDANDGLTSSQPRRTIQAAIDGLFLWGARSDAPKINVAAGTYNEALTIPDYQAQGSGFLTISGASTATVVTTPTTIIDGTSLSPNGTVDGGRGNKVKLEYLLFTNIGSGVDCTITGVGSYSWLYNCQSTDGTARSLGLVDRGGVCLVQGGGKVGGLIGFDCYSGSTLTTGYGATSTADGTFIRSTTQAGFYLKSHVHCVSNYGDYTDNALGVLGYHNARFDTKGDDWKRNTRVYRLQGSYVSENISPASNYNYGTADANTIVFELDQYSALDLYHAGGRSGLDVAHSRATTTLTGTVAATKARALTTVSAYMLTTVGKYIEVECVITGTGAAGTKTVTLQLGATVIGTYTLATGTVTGILRAKIWANNTTSVVVINEVAGSLTLVSAMRAAPAVTMTAGQELAVFIAVPGAADTASMQESRCVLWG